MKPRKGLYLYMTQEDQIQPIEIGTVEMAIAAMQHWHLNTINKLRHFLDIPEGVVISLNGGEDEPLKGDLHRGFTAGMIVALQEILQFPFTPQLDEETEVTPDATSN